MKYKIYLKKQRHPNGEVYYVAWDYNARYLGEDAKVLEMLLRYKK